MLLIIALSYTWDPSEYEEDDCQGVQVQNRSRQAFFPSKVRDCVFHRITKYMRAFNVELLWVDRHSIKQKSCKQVDCQHTECKQKRAALRTMDLVYKLSCHPVALLGRPIKSRQELHLLAKILNGQLVIGDDKTRCFQLSQTTSRTTAREALKLLDSITNDLWWKRAWTFQEDYCSKRKMKLLIPHPPALECQKRRCGFGNIPGEICIISMEFSYQATRLCLALKKFQPQMREKEAINRIVKAAGKYTLLLNKSDFMFSTIISNIEKRDLDKAWDRLDIIANCCQYPVRLDAEGLQKECCSLSLAMLVMCLLNGEVLDNGGSTAPQDLIPQMTVSEYLKQQSSTGFYSPREQYSLTFNKGCRFIDVRLTTSEVRTNGHLWKLGRIIQTAEVSPQLPQKRNRRGNLTLYERERLTQLATKLRSLSYTHIANQIQTFLKYKSLGNRGYRSWDTNFSQDYMQKMAAELVAAADQGKSLRLGSLFDRAGRETTESAIFIWEDDFGHIEVDDKQRGPSTFVFTASRPRDPGSKHSIPNDIDRHVCLEVEYAISTGQVNSVPRLHIKRSLFGLCFFKGSPRMDVVFPWPPALENIVPNSS